MFPVKPINEFNAIIHKEVPTACLKLNRKNDINTGTIIKPPPAPTKPVINPMIIPSVITKGTPNGLLENSSYFISLIRFGFLFLIMLYDEANISSENTNMISVCLESSIPNKCNSSGMAGITNFLTQKTVIREAMAN